MLVSSIKNVRLLKKSHSKKHESNQLHFMKHKTWLRWGRPAK